MKKKHYFRLHQKKHFIFKGIVCLLSLPMSSNAFSAEFDFSGFLSLSGGQLSSSDVTYLNYSDDFKFNNDSKIGFQLNSKINEKWSLTSQLVLKNYSYTNDISYEPILTMAFLSYKPSINHRFRAGVFPASYYYFSDYLDVGTAYPWVRTPNTMYNEQLLEFSRNTGIDYIYRTSIGEWFISTQAIFGQIKDTRTLDGDFEFSNSYGLNFILTHNDLTLRFSLLNLKAAINIESTTTTEGLKAYSAVPGLSSFAEISETMKFDNLDSAYRAVGLIWEPGNWAFYGELYDINTGNKMSGTNSGGYASLLYQIDRFAPYVIFGYSDKESDPSIQEAIESTFNSIPAGIDNNLDDLRFGILQAIENNDLEFRTIGLGLRYDITESAVFKFEVEQLSAIDKQNNGGFRHVKDSYDGDSVYLYSFSVDVNF